MSTSGINELKRSQLAVSFNDTSKCPYCGKNSLRVETYQLKQEDIKARYKCLACGFVCPVLHDNTDHNACKPAYNGEVSKFINEFGIENTN